MSFVKLDCGMLDSTIWFDREARELFITALLMAVPHELREPARAISVRTPDETGFEVPAGWYGLVRAAGVGIVRRAGMDDEAGMKALERLGEPEQDSRSPDFGGRRLVRVDGGYLALNFAKYREKDHTASERSRRYREKMQGKRKLPKSHDKPASAAYKAAEAKAVKKFERGEVDKDFVPVAGNELTAQECCV